MKAVVVGKVPACQAVGDKARMPDKAESDQHGTTAVAVAGMTRERDSDDWADTASCILLFSTKKRTIKAPVFYSQ